jgi:hypothetical protein
MVLALVVSGGSALVFHTTYRQLTGALAGREAAYEYQSGFFLLSTASPIISASDAPDTRVAQAVEAQTKSSYPLKFDLRVDQLWSEEGLVARLVTIFGGDARAANSAAAKLARNAVLRDPLGFINLGWRTYTGYYHHALPGLHRHVEWIRHTNMVSVYNAARLSPIFVEYATKSNNETSLTLRYVLAAGWWYQFLLASPFVVGTALLLKPANLRGVALLLLWTCLLLTATCLGAVESDIRYLQPFSFPSLVGAAVLCETVLRRAGDMK